MNYHKLISDAAAKLNSLVNEIIDACDKEGTPVNPGTIISDLTAKAFPEKDGVTQVDKPEDDGPNEDSKSMAADIQDKLNKAATDEKINMASGAEPTPTPRPLSSDDEWSDDYDKKHEGFEQQAEGLDNLLEGLRDTPHDNRW